MTTFKQVNIARESGTVSAAQHGDQHVTTLARSEEAAPNMADPLTLAIATAVASAASGKAAEGVTEQARQALSAIIGRLRAKLRGHPADLAMVDGDLPAPSTVAELLDREFAADSGFRDEIRDLWLQAAPAANDDTASNAFYGQADKVIQLRDVHGDIHM